MSASRHDRRRVVVTGIGVASPLGNDRDTLTRALLAGESGVRTMRAWDSINHLQTRLAAPANVPDLADLPRKAARTMGRVAMLATFATNRAVLESGLTPEDMKSGRVGLAHGSTHGSSSANEEWVKKLFEQNGFLGLPGTSYLKFMSHTTAANLAAHFGIRGRVMTTCAACVSASHAIGYGYEAVRSGASDVMICGGAEELHFTHAGVFDILHATSTRYNDDPSHAPRPFDKKRDGLVVGEGAGTFVLEERERALAAGKTILAEVLGFGTNCEGEHVTNPTKEGMRGAMDLALADAGLAPNAIGYVNAHATATEVGDIAESAAMFDVFGARVPVSSLKGHLGHTLGACGAIEAAASVVMMQLGQIAPTKNLDEPDPRCAALDYVRDEPRKAAFSAFMSNKFAFGGLNTSLIFGRP